MDLMIRWTTTVRNSLVPILVFMGTLATDDRDKEMTIIWEFMVFLGYGDCHENVMRPTWSLRQTDALSFVFLVNAGP